MKFPYAPFLAVPLLSVILHGADISPSQAEFFEGKIRPLLAERCYECHSAEKKQKGNLLLDTREGTMKGGDTGPAVVAGNPEASLLIKAVKWADKDLRMPPKKQLDAAQIAALEEWIRMGAPYPHDGTVATSREARLFEQGKSHWAFRPLSVNPPPPVKDGAWVRNEIDRHVLASLEQKGIHPSPEADRATLIRRVTLDLIGLPPTPGEVAAFVADQSPQAWERVIDRLLASPHYGERWGRHWLDLARYADSSGFHNDLDRPNAWKYRDYVIRSFNEDKPWARFVAEQLAGDEVDGADEQSLIATGFCRNGPSNDDNMGKTPEALAQYRADQLDDVIATTGAVFLGATIGCARCHNHKTDPFSTKDYYSLFAIFNGTQKYGLVPGTEDATGKKVKVDASVKIQALVERSAKVPVAHVLRRGLAANPTDEVGPAVPAVLTAFSKDPVRFPEPGADAKTSLRRRTLAEWIASPENALAWRVLANRVWQHHFGKGIVATPSNFGFTGAVPTHPELLDFLARQLIANGGHLKPLHKLMLMSATYRQCSVISGKFLVGRRTGTDDVRGSGQLITPSLITSYSRSEAADPSNTLLWRANLRRMEAEAVRDSILAVSGTLNAQAGGPGIKPRLRPELLPASQRNKWPAIEKEDAQHWRRSVYIYTKRQLLMPMMELFDAPTTTDSCAARLSSVVPTQALVLMNDEFVEEHAASLAERAIRESENDPRRAIERMFLLTTSHAPSVERMKESLAFVHSREGESNRTAALTDLAHVLLNSSEFIHIE